MAQSWRVQVDGLREFRRDLKRADAALPRALTAAIKDAGIPILKDAALHAPRRSGALAAGYTVRAAGTVGNVVNRVPYAAGAEWGSHRKWKGFLRYGGPGRFVAKAVDRQADVVMERLYQRLREVLDLYGWAR